jgi:hypothetical protein
MSQLDDCDGRADCVARPGVPRFFARIACYAAPTTSSVHQPHERLDATADGRITALHRAPSIRAARGAPGLSVLGSRYLAASTAALPMARCRSSAPSVVRLAWSGS